jgi:Amt family ammonium transporter
MATVPPQIQPGDTAWLLVATAQVMLMVPGLALFYGGMVQGKNVLSTFMHSFFALALVSVQWALFGYSLAFGSSHGGLVGGLQYVGLQGLVGTSHGSVPHLIFVAYQAMFAAITPALISGAYAERLKFSTSCVFTLLWTTLVYDPVAHWAWAPDGWLCALGALDFAGGTVVHLTSGVAALVMAMLLGPRLGYPATRHHPHNVTMTCLGGGLLWFGWFGFNGGSALAADSIAALAFINTHLAAAAGALAWAAVEQRRFGKVTLLGVISGLVAGLVGITPAAGFVTPVGALCIGALTAGVCFAAVVAKGKLGYDDALDAFGVHGVGGACGALLLALFASRSVNAAGADGLLLGQAALLGKQLIALGATAAYAAAMTFIIGYTLHRTMGLRVSAQDEREGLDTALHGENGYQLGM